MERIRLGIVGLGGRGFGNTHLLLTQFDDVDIVAVCDQYQDRVDACVEDAERANKQKPFGTVDYREILKREDIDAVCIFTDWELHIPIAIEAMKAGKGVALEVGGAYSVQDCFDLVQTWEDTRVPFMILENCCYNREELLGTAMVRHGLLGKIVYAHGAYAHDLRGEVAKGEENRHYRLRNYKSRNCENYPTHELGPIAKILGINRGNRMVSLVSMASGSNGLKAYCEKNKETLNPHLEGVDFAQADIVDTLIRCENGETISIRLDTTLPRSYSREFTIRGTGGLYQGDTNTVFQDGDWEDFDTAKYVEKTLNNAKKYNELLPDGWKNVTQEQLDAGHGGMDYFEFRDFIDRYKAGRPMALDVYDCASWMVITPLSAESIANGSAPVQIPDFTHGEYKNRKIEDVYDL